MCQQLTDAVLATVKKQSAKAQRSGNNMQGTDEDTIAGESVQTRRKGGRKAKTSNGDDFIENLAEGFFVLRRIFDPSIAGQSQERKIYQGDLVDMEDAIEAEVDHLLIEEQDAEIPVENFIVSQKESVSLPSQLSIPMPAISILSRKAAGEIEGFKARMHAIGRPVSNASTINSRSTSDSTSVQSISHSSSTSASSRAADSGGSFMQIGQRLPDVLNNMRNLIKASSGSMKDESSAQESNQMKKRKIAQPIDLTGDDFMEDLRQGSKIAQTLPPTVVTTSFDAPPVNLNFQTECSPVRFRTNSRANDALAEERIRLLAFCRNQINNRLKSRSAMYMFGFDPSKGNVPLWPSHICGDCTSVNDINADTCARDGCSHQLLKEFHVVDFDAMTSAVCKVRIKSYYSHRLKRILLTDIYTNK